MFLPKKLMIQLDAKFEEAIDSAAFDALKSHSSTRNTNYRSKILDLDIDSLKTAEVCADVQKSLRDAGYEVTQDVVDFAVQGALTDSNATVGSAVSAVRRNLFSEISLQALRDQKRQPV